MATVRSNTFPGTPFRIKISATDAGFDVTVAKMDSEIWSTPRHFQQFEQIAALLAEIGVVAEEIARVKRSLAENGKAETLDALWLLDEQGAEPPGSYRTVLTCHAI